MIKKLALISAAFLLFTPPCPALAGHTCVTQ
jgi:hypothetical protein